MIQLNISLRDDRSLYEQIYEYIRDEIRKKNFRQGERLPSTRSLSEFLSVSRTTVERAYDQLLAEGYIEARPQRGFFVCDVGDLLSLSEMQKKSNSQMVFSQVVEEDGKGDGRDQADLIDFSPRAISMKEFPYATWKKIYRELLVGDNSSLFEPGPHPGDADFRESVARYLRMARGVRCTREQIIIGAGTDYLYLLLEKLLNRINPTPSIGVEAVNYGRAFDIFQEIHWNPVTVGMDENGILVSQLENSGASLVYVMPAHQYPTGIIMSGGRRSELFAWAKKKEERYIIEDDYDSEFRYRGKPIPALQSWSDEEKVIYMGTFSKTVAPAMRIGYMVLPEKLMGIYHEMEGTFSSSVARISQGAMNVFLRDGYFERHLNKMRRIYRSKHDLLLKELAGIPSEYAIYGADAGLHILLVRKCDPQSPDQVWDGELEKRLAERALQAGVRIYPISGAQSLAAVSGKNYGDMLPSYLRGPSWILGFGGLSEEEIHEGCRRLMEVLRNRANEGQKTGEARQMKNKKTEK